jgi:hypothetical protein
MFYRENGQFKTSYAADQQIFGVAQDRWVILLVLAFAFLAIPFIASDYTFQAILIPFRHHVAGGAGTQHPRRLLRPDFAGYRRLHGRGCLCGLQPAGPH